MEDIATRFEKEAQCIDEQVGGRIISRQAGREARAILDSCFARALADQYLKLPSFTEEGRARVTAVVFARAWAEGHASGHAEVENQYIDLSDIVDVVVENAPRR